jgi:Zn-dependent M28 family amino/carboxypeptidase
MLIIFTVFLVIDVAKSSGSIDNASGVSILIELSKVLAKNPLKNIDVLFLWAGAEEWGNKGSKHFCQTQYNKLAKKYDLNNSYNINIDMVGSYIGLLDKFGILRKKSMNKNLNKVIEQSSKDLKIPLELYTKSFEPRSDHRSFRFFEKKTGGNFQLCCFHSDKDSKYIHSLKDTPDKCSTANLNGCLDICYETILKLDSQAN